jgi:hypothetical protein
MVARDTRAGMASTLVHVALAAVLAVALLGPALDRRSALVVLAATALVDADTFLGLVVPGLHRAATHTFVLPVAMAVLVYVDTHVRERSLLARLHPHGGRVAWVTLVAVAAAGIGLDMVINGVNAFWPLHDQFYTVDGKALLTDQRGFVQTFVEVDPPEPESASGGGGDARTTKNFEYSTGVNPANSEEKKDPERVFPLVRSGWQALLVVVGYGTLGIRLWERRTTSGEGEEADAAA